MMIGIQRLLLSLWAGCLWSTGYLVAPVLFATLADRALAGAIAGQLFQIVGWMSLIVSPLGLIARRYGFFPDERKIVWCLLGVGSCAAVGLFVLQPWMAELRRDLATNHVRFGQLHLVSSLLYLVESVLAAVLVVKHR